MRLVYENLLSFMLGLRRTILFIFIPGNLFNVLILIRNKRDTYIYITKINNNKKLVRRIGESVHC